MARTCDTLCAKVYHTPRVGEGLNLHSGYPDKNTVRCLQANPQTTREGQLLASPQGITLSNYPNQPCRQHRQAHWRYTANPAVQYLRATLQATSTEQLLASSQDITPSDSPGQSRGAIPASDPASDKHWVVTCKFARHHTERFPNQHCG